MCVAAIHSMALPLRFKLDVHQCKKNRQSTIICSDTTATSMAMPAEMAGLIPKRDSETKIMTAIQDHSNQKQAIVATGLTKWFGEGDLKTMVIKNVDFVAYFGEILFIVGPSGSGKTTLLSIISGILRPNSGKVLVNGADIWQLGKDQLADFRLNKIGFVFQDYHLFPRLTTAENVAIPLILRERNWNESLAEARKYVDIVGLKARSEVLPVKLSGGEQQRVAIARAIIGTPEILILDEPTASLDGDSGKMIISFIRENFLNQNRCIVIVTHDARINEYADRIIHMEDGRITGLDKGTQ